MIVCTQIVNIVDRKTPIFITKDKVRKEKYQWLIEQLRRLLKNEFKTIKKPVNLVYDKRFSFKTGIACVLKSKYLETECIVINLDLYEKQKLSKKDMKEVLRHELLHIEMDMPDSNIEFGKEAYKRRIVLSDKDWERVMATLFWEDITSLFFF